VSGRKGSQDCITPDRLGPLAEVEMVGAEGILAEMGLAVVREDRAVSGVRVCLDDRGAWATRGGVGHLVRQLTEGPPPSDKKWGKILEVKTFAHGEAKGVCVSKWGN